MIKKFKIFERLKYGDDKKELIEQLDEDDIDYFYNKNHRMDADEIISIWPDSIWDHIDNNSFIEDIIKDEVNSRELTDFDEYDYKNYIKEHLTEDKKQKILDIYKSNNEEIQEDNEDVEDVQKDIEFEEYMIDELSEDELREMIEDSNEESEFMKSLIRNWYYNSDAKSYFEEFYGYKSFNDIYEKEKYSYIKPDDIVKNAINQFRRYINDDDLEKSYIGYADYDTKVDDVSEDILYDKELQKKLLKVNKKNVLTLVELIDDKKSIGKEYKFQKAYIEEYLKDSISDDEEIYTEDEKKDIIADSLKFLYDRFGLDTKIEKEYENELWLVHSSKYNM